MSETTVTATFAATKISGVDGAAFIDIGALLTTRLGDKIVVTDSAGASISGYIKAAGTGETLGNELIDAWTATGYETFTTVGTDITSAVNTDGSSARCYKAISSSLLGILGKASVGSFTLNSGTAPFLSMFATAAITVGLSVSDPIVAGSWYRTFYIDTYNYIGMRRDSNTDWSASSISLKQVLTPSATGVTITSTPDGSTYNWEKKDSAFNYADASGYTITITNSMFEVLIYRLLSANAAVKRRINTRIFPVVMPQDVVLPAVSYQRISADPANTLAGASGLVNAHIVINSWSRNYDEAKALALEIRTAMNTASTFKSLLTNELDGYDPDVSLYVVSQDFSVWGEE
jgi:hypothetical protein